MILPDRHRTEAPPEAESHPLALLEHAAGLSRFFKHDGAHLCRHGSDICSDTYPHIYFDMWFDSYPHPKGTLTCSLTLILTFIFTYYIHIILYMYTCKIKYVYYVFDAYIHIPTVCCLEPSEEEMGVGGGKFSFHLQYHILEVDVLGSFLP